MSWFKENKFIAILTGVTVVLAGGILSVAVSKNGEYESSLEEYEELSSAYNKQGKIRPYPNEENLKARELEMTEYQETLGKVKTAFEKYKPATLEAVSPIQFSEARLEMEKGLLQAFEAAQTKIPGGCNFGFEKYASAQPQKDAATELFFQLGAVNSMLSNLAKAKPAELINIRRSPIQVESAKVEEASSRGGENELTYEKMPLELVFRASESSVKKFLQDVVNADDYFYMVNVIRILNDRGTAPNESDVTFTSATGDAAADVGAFAGFDLDEDDSEEPEEESDSAVASTKGAQILKQVLGDELITVYLNMDVLLMKAAEESGGRAGS